MSWKTLTKAGIILLLLTVGLVSLLDKPEEPAYIQATSEQATSANDKELALPETLEDLLTHESLDGAIAGITVRHAETGDILFAENGDIRLHPASNMKLLTAASALETLGADYRFSTEVLTDGVQKGDELQGNLYLKGKGDPSLLVSDLVQFTEELKAHGIKTIKGNLIADDKWYDDIRLSQDLNWSDEPFYTGAQVSALTLSPDEDYDAGTILVEVSPAQHPGEKAKVRVSPETDYVTIVNNSETVTAGQKKAIKIEREHGTNRIIIDGEMPIDGTVSRSWAAVWEPTGYTLSVFRKVLEEQGIRFVGESKSMYGSTPVQAKLLTDKKSQTLSELLIPFLKLSNNGIGEVLTKEMGKVVHGEGSWEKGLAVMEDTLSTLGINMETVLLRDGSGMSHKNLIPANQLSQLLYQIQNKEWFPVFKQALPVAGEEERLVGGTLRHRMTEIPVKGSTAAKTGSITGVSTLAGYITNLEGEAMIFSILINNYVAPNDAIQEIENEIVRALVTHKFQ